MKTVIFANGVLGSIETAKDMAAQSDYIIAADGGAKHCEQLGIVPDLLIGDLDSVTDDDLRSLTDKGVEIIRHPVHKDQTDLELAVREARNRGADDIAVVGALGGRWDMTLANVMLLGANLAGINVRLVDGPHELFMLYGGNSITVQGGAGDLLSLIPLGREARGVTLEGLEYPLNDALIEFGSTLGISNVFLGEKAIVHLVEGALLCVHLKGGAPK
jgi:thiamine pyrophosphokinase